MPMKARYTTVNGQIIAERREGSRRVLVPDAVGSTIALVDNAATSTDTFEYWPYGTVRRHTGTSATLFGYIGTLGYHRDASERSYVRARHLRHDTGSWSTLDPLFPEVVNRNAGFINPYAYANGNPARYVDPSGLLPPNAMSFLCQAVGAFMAALGGAAAGWAIGIGVGAGGGAVVGCVGGVITTGPGAVITCPAGVGLGAVAGAALGAIIGAVVGANVGFVLSKDLCEGLVNQAEKCEPKTPSRDPDCEAAFDRCMMSARPSRCFNCWRRCDHHREGMSVWRRPECRF